jgi:hypothetical protein
MDYSGSTLAVQQQMVELLQRILEELKKSNA